MTPAGLRSLFRHHRRTTGVLIANPHRFRHTFASDMVRAGISLPALMQLDGPCQHSDHADLCGSFPAGRLSAIRPRRGTVHPPHPGDRIVKRPRAGLRSNIRWLRLRCAPSIPSPPRSAPVHTLRTAASRCAASSSISAPNIPRLSRPRSVAPRSARPRLDDRMRSRSPTPGPGHLHQPAHRPARAFSKNWPGPANFPNWPSCFGARIFPRTPQTLPPRLSPQNRISCSSRNCAPQ